MSDPGYGESTAGSSPDEVEVPGTLLSLPDLILRRHGVHWSTTRRRSVPAAPVARSPDTPLSFPTSSSGLPPSGKKQPPKLTSRSTCRDSQRVDSLLKYLVRLQSSNGDLPLDLNKPPTETMLRSSEKSGDELESTIRLQSNNNAGLLLDLNAFPPEDGLRSSLEKYPRSAPEKRGDQSEKSGDELESIIRLQSNNGAGLLLDLNALPPEDGLGSSPEKYSRSVPEKRGDQSVPERSRSIIPDLNLPAAEFSGDVRS